MGENEVSKCTVQLKMQRCILKSKTVCMQNQGMYCFEQKKHMMMVLSVFLNELSSAIIKLILFAYLELVDLHSYSEILIT